MGRRCSGNNSVYGRTNQTKRPRSGTGLTVGRPPAGDRPRPLDRRALLHSTALASTLMIAVIAAPTPGAALVACLQPASPAPISDLGINDSIFSKTTSVFAKVDVTFGDDVSGVGGQAGMRVAW